VTPNPLRLLDWEVPPVRHQYTRRDTAFYALSLGAGAQALDGRQLALVDPWHPELKALPSMALVLGYPGFWLGEAAVQELTGINPWQILHTEQWVELPGIIPNQGSVVGETSVKALVDKGVDRGSILYTERKIFDEASGALLATCRQAYLLRQAGGFGSAGQPPTALAMTSSDKKRLCADCQTLPQQALLYRLNGDANPLHVDPDLATRAGFPRPILHGMCTTGMAVLAILGVCTDFDPERVRGFAVRMTRPVLPGDTLRTEVWLDGSFRTRAVERDVVVLNDGHIDLVAA
jgi:acyl dehydratase